MAGSALRLVKQLFAPQHLRIAYIAPGRYCQCGGVEDRSGERALVDIDGGFTALRTPRRLPRQAFKAVGLRGVHSSRGNRVEVMPMSPLNALAV